MIITVSCYITRKEVSATAARRSSLGDYWGLLVGYMYATARLHARLANPRLGTGRVVVAFLIGISIICKSNTGKISESSSRNL